MNPDFNDAIFKRQNGTSISDINFKEIKNHLYGLINDFQEAEKNSLLSVTPEDLMLDDSLINKMPTVMRHYLDFASPLSDVPNEFLITPFLAIAGAAIGSNRFIQLGGIKVHPTIWTVLFAGSSTLRKSTALRLAKKPFKPIEANLNDLFKKEINHWESTRELADIENKSFNEDKPIKKSLYCSDGFSDLIFWEALRDNKSLISMPGEFTALWGEVTRPRNSMQDLALSIFDAEDSVRRTTKSGGDIELNNPVWCIAGATTLSSFRRTLTSTERGSGMLQRILPVCMERRTKQFKALTELEEPNWKLKDLITSKTSILHNLKSEPVPISDRAKGIYTDWSHDLNECSEQLSKRLEGIGGYISRLNVYALKIALIFQQLDRPGASITEQNMKGAIGLCEWLLKHIIYMLNKNYIFNRHFADRVKVRKIISKQSDNIITRTDLMNLSNFDKAQLDRALASELEAGKIKKLKTDTGGRPLIQYKLLEST